LPQIGGAAATHVDAWPKQPTALARIISLTLTGLDVNRLRGCSGGLGSARVRFYCLALTGHLGLSAYSSTEWAALAKERGMPAFAAW
jgi:hypothetical protein